MSTIVIFGGTGYTGHNLAEVAASRGHRVIAIARHEPKDKVEGVEYRIGDAREVDKIPTLIEDADVVLAALSPRGNMSEKGLVSGIEHQIGLAAQAAGARYGVVGGAGSLHVSEGGPLIKDVADEKFLPEINELYDVYQDLAHWEGALEWFYVSPGSDYGPWEPGEATGKYRLGTDTLIRNDEGRSFISGHDLAVAVLDEVENPQFRNARFTVAY